MYFSFFGRNIEQLDAQCGYRRGRARGQLGRVAAPSMQRQRTSTAAGPRDRAAWRPYQIKETILPYWDHPTTTTPSDSWVRRWKKNGDIIWLPACCAPLAALLLSPFPFFPPPCRAIKKLPIFLNGARSVGADFSTLGRSAHSQTDPKPQKLGMQAGLD